MSTKSPPSPPNPLREDHITARIIRDRLWRPAARGNDWRVFAIVGREGTGKSLTCASILRAADPSFGVGRTHFEPIPFFHDIAEEMDRPGVAVMSDEAGVAFGNRTWHDREQIEANQALQTARNYNRIVGLTAPRLEEIDKQLQGRLHFVIETVGMREGEFVDVKWYGINPSRKGQNEIRTPFPRKSHNGRVQRITRLKIGPPPQSYIDEYEVKKRKWQEELFGRVINRYEEEFEEDPDLKPKQIAQTIKNNGGVEKYVSESSNGKHLSWRLIGAEYDVGRHKAKTVKELLEKDGEMDV